MINNIRKIFNKYKHYDYIDADFSKYRIKSPEEFYYFNGGICWDFVGSIAKELDKYDIPWKCYYTGIYKGDRTLATHTYIIADNKFWIECSWQKYKGTNIVSSYKDVEDLLVDTYHGEKVYTVEYNPLDTFGMTDYEFFDYLENNGK